MRRRLRPLSAGVYVWLPNGETWYWTNSYEHTRMDMAFKALKREARRKGVGRHGA